MASRHHARWYAGNSHIVSDRTAHDSASSHRRPATNRRLGQDDGTDTNQRLFANGYVATEVRAGGNVRMSPNVIVVVHGTASIQDHIGANDAAGVDDGSGANHSAGTDRDTSG
jgi:hypothetical protein